MSMKIKVWAVKMGDLMYPTTFVSTRNVCATTLRDAISKADKAERDFCVQMSEEGGEKVVPDKAIAVNFLCELDDE